MSEKIYAEAIDEFLIGLATADPKKNRFDALICFAENYNETHLLDSDAQKAFVACINARITMWPPEGVCTVEEGEWDRVGVD